MSRNRRLHLPVRITDNTRNCRKTKTTFMDGIISKKSTALFEQNYTIAEVLSTFSDSLRTYLKQKMCFQMYTFPAHL